MDKLLFEHFVLLLVFVLPGFVSVKVYHSIIPIDIRKPAQSIVELVFYGALNLGIILPFVILVRSYILDTPILFAVVAAFGLLIVPTAIGFGFAHFRRSRLMNRLGLLHPIPVAWDYYFDKRKPAFVLFSLKSGEMVGGYYGPDSFASSFPNREDIYIEKVCRLNVNNGQIVGFVPDSDGMLIRREDCDAIQFFQTGM